MLALLLARVDPGNHLRQLAGAHIGLCHPIVHDGASNLLGEALLTEGFQHPGDVVHIGTGQPLGGALTGGGIHPHVERAVLHEAEATFGIVKLGGGDTEIQQEAIDLAQQAALGQIAGDAGEGTVHDLETGILDLGRLGNGLGIPVDGDQTAIGAQMLENETRVTTPAKGTVDVDTVRLDGQPFDGFVQQHCDVFSGLGHL